MQFKYDPMGRRIEKIAPSGTTIFAYDGDNVVETTNSSGGILSRFAQGQNVDEPLAESASGATDYYEADGLGSITSLTNGTGTVAQTYTYDSFGNVTHSTGSLANPFQYTARDFDTETGLYYYRARYYDPSTGRFLSEDPIRFRAGLDFYRYAFNQPTLLIDPLGLQVSHGPEHPLGFSACTWDDDCSTLSRKIELFEEIIANHLAWDATFDPGRHDTEIRDFFNGLRNCIVIHQAKCTNKPCKQPSPPPEPAPEPAPSGGPIPLPPPPSLSPQQVQGATIGIGGIIVLWLMILGSPAGV